MGGILFNNNAINQKGTPLLYTDIFANRPQAAIKGRLFFSTDTSAIYEDTGSAWILLANVAGSGSVGTLEQVTTNGNSTNQGITITANGLTSNKVVVSGGTSSQFLKADGSLDSNTYLTTGSASSTYQPLITLTTTGTSGAATFSGNTLNIPNYGTALSGYLPLSGGTLTGTLIGTGIVLTNGITASSFNTIGGTASQFLKANGSLDSNTYLTTSNAASTYQPLITLTTTGTSGSATFSGNTLNIPNYGSALSGYVPYSGATGTVNLNAQTLTNVGALSGISANFSGDFTLANPSANTKLFINRANSTYSDGIFYQTNGTYDFVVGQNPLSTGTSDYSIYSYGASAVVFNIARSTGAATFSSSVNSASSALQINPTNGYNVLIGQTTDAGYKLQVNGTASVTQIITSQTWLNASTFNQSFTISPANGAGTTIISNNSTNYTWTMEPAVGNNRMYILRTIGTNTITINTSGSDVIINNAGSSVSSLTMTLSTGAIILQSDGNSRWIQIK